MHADRSTHHAGRTAPPWLGAGPLAGVLAGIVLCAACAACTGCSGPTPYQPETSGGGYTDTQLADDVFDVGYRGNESTPEETVRMSLLYRCAEVTLQHGYRSFVVLEGGYRTSTYTTQTSGVYSGTTRRVGSQAYTTGTLTPGPTITGTRYGGLVRIRTYKTGQAPSAGQVYDAENLIQHIGPQLVMPAAPPK